MAKLIELKEAAALLGITPEELTELRSRSKIFGYRDGSTWKFKEAELERYAAQAGITLGDAPPPEPLAPSGGSSASVPFVDADLDELVDVQPEDELDSILVSENELGSGSGASSTIIGKEDRPEDGASDLHLAADSKVGSSLDFDLDDDSELKLSDESSVMPGSGMGSGSEASGASDLSLDLESGSSLGSDFDLDLESDSLDGSELKLTGDSAAPVAGGESDFDISLDDSGSELRLVPDEGTGSAARNDAASGSDLLAGETSGTGSGTGDLPGMEDDLLLDASGDRLGSEALELGDDELLLEGSGSMSGLNLDESGIDLDLASGTGVGLSQDGSGSDVTLNAGDSGINLGSPSESGISLETEGTELGGSGIEALELGEADIVDLDDAEVDIDAATQLKADDDFLLSPAENALGDDADSGSQVIALDTEEFDDSADSMLGDSSAVAVMEVDEEFGSLPEQPGAGAPVAATAPAGVVVGDVAEAPYSIWNVLGLFGCLVLLSLTGIMMIDLLRNMWSWSQPYSLNSSLMDFIISLFGT